MGKNNYLLSVEKRLREQLNNITPDLYAGIALALHRKHGWGFNRINDLFTESQRIWNECVQNDDNIRRMCEEETGIDVQRKVEEKDGKC